MAFGTIKKQVFVILKHCELCGMLFITSSLQNHKRKHTKSQNAKCLLYLLHLSQRKKLLDSSSTTPEIRPQVPNLSKKKNSSKSPFRISLVEVLVLCCVSVLHLVWPGPVTRCRAARRTAPSQRCIIPGGGGHTNPNNTTYLKVKQENNSCFS